MGGIAGMIRFDGQPINDSDRRKITDLLTHRGEVVTHSVEGGLLMAFGGKIEENGAVCAAADTDIYTVQPGYLFTQSCNRLGMKALNELNADFSLALWDQNQQTLFCARDIMGVKPLYYVHQPGRFVAFASEIKALLALREVVVRANEFKFREYLTWSTDYLPYSAETFHESVYSVLPGHYVQINARCVEEHSYWQIDLTKYAGLKRPEEYSALFQDYFTRSVGHRISGKKLVGSHLSGGLDSSSVSCVAQSLLTRQHRGSLHTFNINTEQPSADEQEFVQEVVTKWHPTHHTIHPVTDVLDAVLKINQFFDRPEHFIIPSSFHLSVSLAAQQLGCDSLLTGHDGDSVVTMGLDFIDELVDAEDWAHLKIACQQFIDLPDRNLFYIDANWLRLSSHDRFEKYALYVIGNNLKKRFREKTVPGFVEMIRHQKSALGLSTPAILSFLSRRLVARLKHTAQISSPLSGEFTQRVPARAYRSTKNFTATSVEGQHIPLNQVLHTTNIICNEQMNHIGAYYGHQYSFPFFDKDVIELCLATPYSVHFDEGRGRGLIRNGLRQVLPPAIVSRFTKANFVEYGTISAQQLYRVTQERFSSPNHAIWRVINQKTFSQIVNTVFDQHMPVVKKTRFNWMLCRIIYLALWMDTLPKGT